MSYLRLTLAAALACVAEIGFGAPIPAVPVDPKAPATDRFGDPLPPFAIARLGTTRWRQPLRDGHGFSSVAVAKGGKHVLSVGDANFIVWEVASGQALPWSLMVKGVTAAAFSADGKTIVTVENEEQRDLPPGGGRHDLAVTRVRFRDAETGRIGKSNEFERSKPFIRFGNDLLFLDRNLILGVDSENKLTAWDFQKGAVRWQTEHKGTTPGHFAVAPNNASGSVPIAWVRESGDIDVIELSTGKRLQVIASTSDEPHFVHAQFSANGRHLKIGDLSNKTKIVEIATGKVVDDTDRIPFPAAVSHDGTTLAQVTEGRITLCDARSLKEIRSLQQSTSRWSSLAFSPDDTWIVTGEEYTIGLWDTATGMRLNPTPGHDMSLCSIAFSPDGTRIASGGEDECAILWQIDGAKVLQRWTGHCPMAYSLAFRKDGRVLAVGDGAGGAGTHMAEVHLWDTENGQPIRRFMAHLNAVASIAFSDDGKTLYTAGSDARIRIWDPATGVRVDQIRFAWQFALRPGERSLLCLSGGYLQERVLDSWKAGVQTRIGTLEAAKTDSFDRLRFVAGGKLAVALVEDQDRSRDVPFAKRLSFRTWDTSTGKQVRSFELPPADVFGSATWEVSPDGELAVLAERNLKGTPRMRLFDLARGTELVQLHGHNDTVLAVAFSPDGNRVATASRDTTVLIWDIRSARDLGLWLRLGDDDRAAESFRARLDEAAPFLLERVAAAIGSERASARWIAELASDDPAAVERAGKRLASDPSAEFALRLAARAHPKAVARERAAKALAALTAARPDEVEKLVAIFTSRDKVLRYADLRFLGPAAKETFNAARDQYVARQRFARRAIPDPFADQAYLAAQLPPAAVLKAIRLLAAARAPEADRLLRELATGPEDSRLVQEARTALSDRKK